MNIDQTSVPEPTDDVVLRFVETNGITMRIAEQGIGPLVVLCHGWPEAWFSWRHQIDRLARAGYHVVAPDMRGFGGTDQPPAAEDYTTLHSVGDIVGLLDELGEQTAVIVGHDWGASIAWACAQLRPDRFRAVVGVSGAPRQRSRKPPIASMRAAFGDRFNYVLHFQKPGVAEAELEADPRRAIQSLFSAGRITGDSSRDLRIDLPSSAGFWDMFDEDGVVTPPWVTEAELDRYGDAYARSGFASNLNWYRNIDRNWALAGAFAGSVVSIPALFVTGDSDSFNAVVPWKEADLRAALPDLRIVVFEGCGHWVTQERADDLATEILKFLSEIDTKDVSRT